MNQEIDDKLFHSGLIGSPPRALVIQVPIEQYANDGPDGLDMFYGKMKRMEALGARLIRDAFERKQKAGVIGPTGVPLSVV